MVKIVPRNPSSGRNCSLSKFGVVIVRMYACVCVSSVDRLPTSVCACVCVCMCVNRRLVNHMAYLFWSNQIVAKTGEVRPAPV